MANRMHGVYDPGAVSGQFQEADVALAWVSVLRRELLALNDVEVFLTRANNVSPTPLQRRAAYAKEMNCDALLSLHTNAFRDDAANGVETLWRTSGSDRLASVVNQVLVHEMGLRDRGIKRRPLLAVLSFQPSVLLELGFITNAADRVAMHSDEIRQRTCRRLARVVVAHLRGGQD
jgi:N-acetylmuramoyl-L-alanine amidase